MFPVLIETNSITIHTYFFMAALGFIMAMGLGSWRALQEGYDLDTLLDILLIVIFGGFIGARIVYVMTEPQEFEQDPLKALYFWRGGLVWYGGPLLCIPLCVLYGYLRGLPVGPGLDIAGCSIPLGHMFGRIGCLGYGCCYGRMCDPTWGLVFPRLGDGIPRYPTQAIEALGLFLLWLIGETLYRREARTGFQAPQRGLVMAYYLVAYGILRFATECLRGDDRGPEYLLSVSQWISLSGVIVGLALSRFLYRRLARSSLASAT